MTTTGEVVLCVTFRRHRVVSECPVVVGLSTRHVVFLSMYKVLLIKHGYSVLNWVIKNMALQNYF